MTRILRGFLPALLLGVALVIVLCTVLVAASAPARANVPTLSFERGASILENPAASAISLRSAGVPRVRLQLYHLQDSALLAQIMAARASQTITETGLQQRVMATQTPLWRAGFVLPDEATATATLLPLEVATGPLPQGFFMLLAESLPDEVSASGSSTPSSGAAATNQQNSAAAKPLQAVQWFWRGDLALHVFAAPAPFTVGQVIITTNRQAALPVGNTCLTLLDHKGQALPQNPDDWQTDSSGAVFWQGTWPAGAVLLRAADARGHTVFADLQKMPQTLPPETRGRGLAIQPQFQGRTIAAGSTAGFSIALRDNQQVLPETLRYEFARLTHSYRWQRGADNMWQYQVLATPTVIQRGTLRPNRGAAAAMPYQLLLAVTEGRFRLTVSTPDGSLRQALEFTAGWWRNVPPAPPVLNFQAQRITADTGTNAVQITNLEMAETAAPRWLLGNTNEGNRNESVAIAAANAPLLPVPVAWLADKPLAAALCGPVAPEPETATGAVACGVQLVMAPPADVAP